MFLCNVSGFCHGKNDFLSYWNKMAPLNEFYPSFYLLIFLSVLVSLKKTAKTFTEQFSLPFFFFFFTERPQLDNNLPLAP